MDDDQHNEFGSEISEEDDVQDINDKDDVVEVDKNHKEDGVDLTECVVDEQVEVDIDEIDLWSRQIHIIRLDNKSKVLKWTKILKTTNEDVSNIPLLLVWE